MRPLPSAAAGSRVQCNGLHTTPSQKAEKTQCSPFEPGEATSALSSSRLSCAMHWPACKQNVYNMNNNVLTYCAW
jgi:hypothetical protein